MGSERGQGTVEWVGVLAVVGLAMVGLVAVGVRIPGGGVGAVVGLEDPLRGGARGPVRR